MEYLYTERAHLMCPRMCFGLAAAVNACFDEKRLRDSIGTLSAAHPFLNALLGYDERKEAYYYDITENCKADLFIKQETLETIEAPEVLAEYRRLTACEWNLFRDGMLKITVWRMKEGTCFLLVFHHLLADGRGALGLLKELADCYAKGTEPSFAREKLISHKEDFPSASRLPFVSRLLVSRANRAWKAEGRRVSYEEYRAFADSFLKTDKVEYTLSRVCEPELSALSAACHENRVSVNDYLMAKMFHDEGTDKLIIACDLRDRLACYTRGALGNYSTAFSVTLKKRFGDPFEAARAVRQKVQKKLNTPSELYLVLQCYAELEPGLLDAACISCRGGFPSKPGKFIGGLFFGFNTPKGYSLTNLGRIESGTIRSAYFIPPASPAVKKTCGALTVNGRMMLCASGR